MEPKLLQVCTRFLVRGRNHIRIDTDAPNTGCWCVGVGYVEIRGRVGFQVVRHTPRNRQIGVNWQDPKITIDFSQEVKPSTINANTIKLEYRNQARTILQIPATLTLVTAMPRTPRQHVLLEKCTELGVARIPHIP